MSAIHQDMAAAIKELAQDYAANYGKVPPSALFAAIDAIASAAAPAAQGEVARVASGESMGDDNEKLAGRLLSMAKKLEEKLIEPVPQVIADMKALTSGAAALMKLVYPAPAQQVDRATGITHWPAPVAQQVAAEPTAAARDVLAERQRQVSVEGWTPEHDDAHADESLARAAATYAFPDIWNILGGYAWPWDGGPKFRDARSNLVRAGALILAEIERLDRATQPPAQPAGEPVSKEWAMRMAKLELEHGGHALSDAWADVVEERLHSWRRSIMDDDGDLIALADVMTAETLDDLIDYVCAPLPAPAAQQVAAEPSEVERLRHALVYVAYALHSTRQYMLADGISLSDGDGVTVKLNGWSVSVPHGRGYGATQPPAQPAGEPLATSDPEGHRQAHVDHAADQNARELQSIRSLLDKRSDEDRLELFSHYCSGCGTKNLPCHCQNEE